MLTKNYELNYDDYLFSDSEDSGSGSEERYEPNKQALNNRNESKEISEEGIHLILSPIEESEDVFMDQTEDNRKRDSLELRYSSMMTKRMKKDIMPSFVRPVNPSREQVKDYITKSTLDLSNWRRFREQSKLGQLMQGSGFWIRNGKKDTSDRMPRPVPPIVHISQTFSSHSRAENPSRGENDILGDSDPRVRNKAEANAFNMIVVEISDALE